MELEDNRQVFNLWNTNGRRADILNAIEIYLTILFDINESATDASWGKYPTSLSQFTFYKRAIEASPEVFKDHKRYDQFVADVPFEYLESRGDLSESQRKNLDKNIEMRARHYTSNLVRLGLATDERAITAAGKAYYTESMVRDAIEDILPIATTNLLILRQLLKFRAYTKPLNEKGERTAYSPLHMALYVLLSGVQFDKDDFKTMIQSLTPYNPIDPDLVIEQCKRKDYSFTDRDISVPEEFKSAGIVEQSAFDRHIKNAKSSSQQVYYYEFYKKLFDYYHDRSDVNFAKLKEVCVDDPSKLKQAFGCGKKVFEFGRLDIYEHEEFTDNNNSSPFLTTENFNETFYVEYVKSKVMDQARENADTTSRLFSATGLISLAKALPQLVDTDIYEIVFDRDYLKNNIFATVAEDEYEAQISLFESNASICSIIGYSPAQVKDLLSKIGERIGEDTSSIKEALTDRTSVAFAKHVQEYYPKERVCELLKGFSMPDGGAKARNDINPSCGIPTAYEYIVAIAWSYISDDKYDLYGSMNLTMGADFEPERFAPGGTGDIVAEYEDIIVMLEVTMMNAQAQKRAEWEPVLRHSVNLRVDSIPKDTVTLFVANELDYNTINIWRAVAMVPLKSSNSDDIVTGVDIMPLTNEELADMIENGIGGNRLIKAIKESYSAIESSFDESWRDSIINEMKMN